MRRPDEKPDRDRDRDSQSGPGPGIGKNREFLETIFLHKNFIIQTIFLKNLFNFQIISSSNSTYSSESKKRRIFNNYCINFWPLSPNLNENLVHAVPIGAAGEKFLKFDSIFLQFSTRIFFVVDDFGKGWPPLAPNYCTYVLRFPCTKCFHNSLSSHQFALIFFNKFFILLLQSKEKANIISFKHTL